MDAAFQLSCWESRPEGQDQLPRPAGHVSFDAVQGKVGSLGCKCTLPGRVQLFIHQHYQALLSRAALSSSSLQPVLIPGAALTKVHYLVLGLVELHEIRMGPLLQLVDQHVIFQSNAADR